MFSSSTAISVSAATKQSSEQLSKVSKMTIHYMVTLHYSYQSIDRSTKSRLK